MSCAKEKTMTEIDLEGKAPESFGPKVLVPEDSYESTCTKIEGPLMMPVFKKKKPTDPDKEEKFIFSYQVVDAKQGKVEIPRFAKNKVRKGDGDYSNTGLYDDLAAAGALDTLALQKDALKDTTKFVEFLNHVFVGKRFKILVETSGKNKTPYSVVKKIVRKL